MKSAILRFIFRPSAIVLLWTLSLAAQDRPVLLDVDATDAPRKILHARLEVPVRPGPLTLLYPKWIPGEHGPNGPITDVTNLKFTAAGRTIRWQRDPVDMFAVHLAVPEGASVLEASLDFLLPPASSMFSSGPSASAHLLDLNWNQVLLYPKEASAGALSYAARLRLPRNWKFGTALPVGQAVGDVVEFAPVSLERLVDSPVIAGDYFRTVELTPGANPAHFIDIAADSAAALELKPEDERHFEHLMAETGALFGARHYRTYHFLLTLSDHVAHFGLEHHESSDDRTGERALIDEDQRKLMATLLPHEMTHSWNGKYRRPAGLATGSFDRPMEGELLWVYEGLTDYLGVVLATRCGLWTNENFREYLALNAAALDQPAGRTWRPLADTATAAQILYEARQEGAAARRSVDFYPEGDLLWLEVDTIIRQHSDGRQSIEDFCRRFHGGESGPPKVVPYTLDDLVATLNGVVEYDWRQFFQDRVYTVAPRAPLHGIENAGWHLTYTNSVPDMLKSQESLNKTTDVSFSLGFTVKEDGYIVDVLPGSPSDKAGLGASMKLMAVDSRRWTPEILRAAIKASTTNTTPIELLVSNEDYFKTCKVDYHGGEKYPQLERDLGKRDLLSEVLKPLTPAP